MSNEVLLEQIPGRRIPNLKVHVFYFHLVSCWKIKGKKRKKKQKAQCLKYFHLANWFMARATTYNPSAFREINGILTAAERVSCSQSGARWAAALIPAPSPAAANWAFPYLSGSVHTLGSRRCAEQCRGSETQTSHTASSGVGARAAVSPHKSNNNWVIRDRGHGDPHVTVTQGSPRPNTKYSAVLVEFKVLPFWLLHIDTLSVNGQCLFPGQRK